MLWLLDLMEDATDFSWGSAKTSHAVFPCEMQRGSVSSVSNTTRTDRFRHVYAQKHVHHKQNRARTQAWAKKTWVLQIISKWAQLSTIKVDPIPQFRSKVKLKHKRSKEDKLTFGIFYLHISKILELFKI